MRQPANRDQKLSSSEKNTLVIAAVLGGTGLISLFIFIALVLWQRAQRAPADLPSTSAVPTILVPTPDCGPPTLVLGATTFQIENLPPAPDGSLTAPPDTSGVAYWVESTRKNYVFILSPTPENLALISSLPAGSTAKATWTNCNSTSYAVSAPESGSLSVSTLPDPSIDGITIFVQSVASGNGLLARGELTEEQISTINTPAASGIQAEISLLETTASADGTSIRIGISIYNFGGTTITLSASDVSLTPGGAAPLALIESEPRLPKEIAVAARETFYLTFPRPSARTATLKIFTVEYEIEGY